MSNQYGRAVFPSTMLSFSRRNVRVNLEMGNLFGALVQSSSNAITPPSAETSFLLNTPDSNYIHDADVLARIPGSKQILRQRIAGLYEDALTMSKRSKSKAALLKIGSLMTTFIVILLGATVAILAVFDFAEKNYVMVILGCMVALLKSMVAIFNPEYRASVMKQIHVRARKLARQVMDLIHRALKSSTDETSEMDSHALVSEILTNLQKEYDDLDLASFMATVAAAQTYVDIRTSNESGSLKAMQRAQRSDVESTAITNPDVSVVLPTAPSLQLLAQPIRPLPTPTPVVIPTPVVVPTPVPVVTPVSVPVPVVTPVITPTSTPVPVVIPTSVATPVVTPVTAPIPIVTPTPDLAPTTLAPTNKRPTPPPRQRANVTTGRHWIKVAPAREAV